MSKGCAVPLDLHWPAEHVAWESRIEPAKDLSVPLAVQVFIFHTREQLAAACEVENAEAHSITYDHGLLAVMMLHKGALELSLVAHEVAHIALFWHAHRDDLSRVGARRWLSEHPEHVAEFIGNLTALVWYNIPESGDIAS